ncbi:MAG: hypothetical protein ACJARX_002320 [Psychroserpens sp.]|jgi:hypothetical protein
MTLHTELPVYRDPYKLVLEIFVSRKNFPKVIETSYSNAYENAKRLELSRCFTF